MNALSRLTVLVVVLTAGCRSLGEQQRLDVEASVRAQLDQRMEAYVGALLAGDTSAVRTFWTEDARALGPGMDLTGGAIASFINTSFSAGASVTSLNVRPIDTFVHGNAVYELGQLEETVQVPGQSQATTRTNYFLRWERAPDDTWRVDRFVTGPAARAQ